MTFVDGQEKVHMQPVDAAEEFRLRAGHTSASIRLEDPAFLEWVAARHDFMRKRGWKTGEVDDFDPYDSRPDTKHFTVRNKDDQLAFGMRLTPAQTFDETMSWDMVKDTPIAQQVEEQGGVDAERIWDLTRLVPGPGAGVRTSFVAIPMLFGEGLRYCKSQGDADPTWVFVLDEKMEQWLQRQKVEVNVLGRSKINGDPVESLFASIRPLRIAEQGHKHDFAVRAMGGDG